eukprot:scaffold243476_cov19-Tisochrysis_lutea.AAC.1
MHITGTVCIFNHAHPCHGVHVRPCTSLVCISDENTSFRKQWHCGAGAYQCEPHRVRPRAFGAACAGLPAPSHDRRHLHASPALCAGGRQSVLPCGLQLAGCLCHYQPPALPGQCEREAADTAAGCVLLRSTLQPQKALCTPIPGLHGHHSFPLPGFPGSLVCFFTAASLSALLCSCFPHSLPACAALSLSRRLTTWLLPSHVSGRPQPCCPSSRAHACHPTWQCHA